MWPSDFGLTLITHVTRQSEMKIEKSYLAYRTRRDTDRDLYLQSADRNGTPRIEEENFPHFANERFSPLSNACLRLYRRSARVLHARFCVWYARVYLYRPYETSAPWHPHDTHDVPSPLPRTPLPRHSFPRSPLTILNPDFMVLLPVAPSRRCSRV